MMSPQSSFRTYNVPILKSLIAPVNTASTRGSRRHVLLFVLPPHTPRKPSTINVQMLLLPEQTYYRQKDISHPFQPPTKTCCIINPPSTNLMNTTQRETCKLNIVIWYLQNTAAIVAVKFLEFTSLLLLVFGSPFSSLRTW